MCGVSPYAAMSTTTAFLSCLCACTMLIAGCSNKAPAPASVLTLAASERGIPQFDYSGPGKLSYHQSFNLFSFEIGPLSGAPWVTGKGELNFSDSNHVVISVQSSSDRPYEIELLGVCTNRTLDVPEEKAKEIVRVLAGEQKLSLERFVIWTYDFSKEK